MDNFFCDYCMFLLLVLDHILSYLLCCLFIGNFESTGTWKKVFNLTKVNKQWYIWRDSVQQTVGRKNVFIYSVCFNVILPLFFFFQIGWRGLHKESVYVHMHRWRILNVVYPTVIILLLFYTYMYEILACEWKLNLDNEVRLCCKN